MYLFRNYTPQPVHADGLSKEQKAAGAGAGAVPRADSRSSVGASTRLAEDTVNLMGSTADSVRK